MLFIISNLVLNIEDISENLYSSSCQLDTIRLQELCDKACLTLLSLASSHIVEQEQIQKRCVENGYLAAIWSLAGIVA